MRRYGFKERIICVLLSILMTSGLLLQGNVRNVRAATSDVYTYHLPYSHPAGEYPGGWVRHEGDAIYFFEISEMPGKIAYCMEPGRSRSNGTVANAQTPDQVFSSGNNVLTGEQIKNFTEIILNLGYRGGASGLTTANGVTDPSDNLYYAVATQILLWEVIIGERDASFDYRNTGTRNLADLLLGPVDDTVSDSVRQFHEGEDYWYRQIEAGVRNTLFNRTVPSFAFDTPSQAAAAVGGAMYFVDPSTRTVVLTDSNGVLAAFPHLSFSVNGQPVSVDYDLDAANNRVTIAFNDRSIEIDDVLLTLRSDTAGRSYALVYGDGRWGPDWAESDNWQEITTWGEEEYDYVYVKFTDDLGFSVTKVADSSGDIVQDIAFNLWRYGEGRDSGFYNPGAGDTLIAGGFTDSRGRLVWESVGGTTLDLPSGNYGINEIYVPTYFDTMDGNRIQYPYDTPTDGSRTWHTRGDTSQNHMFYTSFVLNGAEDVNFVLHNRRSQGGFSLNKSIVPLTTDFAFDAVNFTLFYDTDGSGSYTSGDYTVASGQADQTGKVYWSGNGFSGVYRFTDLPSGRYIIRENWQEGNYFVTNTTPGWNRISDTAYEMPFEIPSGGSRNYTVVNRSETGSVEVYKEVTGSSEVFNASSVTFALYQDLDGDGVPSSAERIAEGIPSQEDGHVIWNGNINGQAVNGASRITDLRFGSYIIEETWPHTDFTVVNVTDGWVRIADGRYRRNFEIGRDSQEMVFRITNEVYSGGIEVIKDIPSGDTFDLTSVTFTLVNDDRGDLIAAGRVRSDGTVGFDRDVSAGLSYGRYTLTETWPAAAVTLEAGTAVLVDTVNHTEGWIRHDNDDGSVSYSISFEIDSNRVYSFSVQNDEQTNSLTLYKTPLTDGDECDVRFELYTSEGALYSSATAHTSGQAGIPAPALWGEDAVEILTRVPAGVYTLREYIPRTYRYNEEGGITSACYSYDVPEGFTLSDDGTYFFREVTVEDGENDPVVVTAENRRLEASLRIFKVSETGQREGLGFRLSYRGNGTQFDAQTAPLIDIGTFYTGQDGSVTINSLPVGWYEITELTPELMVCRWAGGGNGNVKRIYIDPLTDNEVNITAMNTISAILRVNKVDEWTGEAVGGASFNLYQDLNGNGTIDSGEEQTCICCCDTDGDGTVVFPGLSGGSYILREAVTVEGYRLNETEFPVEISLPEVYEMTVQETPVTMNLRLYKVDENDASHFLSGAQFEIYSDSNGNGEYDAEDQIATSFSEGSFVPVSVLLTEDEEGVPLYTLDREIRPGTYFLIETRPPEGFVLNEDNCLKIELGRASDTFEISYYLGNGLHGGIRIIKIDEDHPENNLEGAEFTVYSDSDGNGIWTEGTDEVCGTMAEVRPGEYLITELPYGRYFVRETGSPEGFIRRDDVWEVMVTSDSVIYEIADRGFRGIANAPEGSVAVYKHDEDYPDVLLSGAVFTVYDSSDDSRAGVLTEDNGVYTLEGLATGDYYLVETAAPDGFVRDTNRYPFTIGGSGRHVTVDNTENAGRPEEGCFVDRPVRASLKINKIVPEGYSPQGFVFEILRDDDVIIQVTTGPDGTATVEGLRFGTYTIREVECEATRGTFRLAGDVTVTIEGTEEVDGTVIGVDISNRPVPTPKLTVTPAPSVPSTGEDVVGIARVCGLVSAAVGLVLLFVIRRKEGKNGTK